VILVDDISKVKVRDGYVLIAVDGFLKKEFTTKGGLRLFTHSVSDESISQNSTKNGKVLRVCTNTGPKNGFLYMDEKPLIQEGDTAWFDYLVVSKYVMSSRADVEAVWPLLSDGDTEAFIMPYGMVFMIERGGVRHGVNSCVFGKKVIATKRSFLDITEEIDPNYLEVEIMPIDYEGPIKKGDIVVTNTTARPLEFELHTDEPLYFINKQRAMAIKQNQDQA
jgi:hypothetical protein